MIALPDAVIRSLPDVTVRKLFQEEVEMHFESGLSEARSFLKAYSALEQCGYSLNGSGVWVRKDAPTVSDVHVDRPLGSDSAIPAGMKDPREDTIRQLLGRKKKPKQKDDPGTQDIAPPYDEMHLSIPRQGGESSTVTKEDQVTFDVPLFIRLLEVAREEIKEDEPLHVITERIVSLMKEKPLLTMQDYDQIVSALQQKREKQKDDPGTVDVAIEPDKFVTDPPVQEDARQSVRKRISGQSPISLNARGKLLADKLGQKIAERGGLDVLHLSPLNRAKQTAEAIAKHNPEMQLAEPEDGLRPWRLGDIEGRDSEDVSDLIKHYIEHPDEVPPGKGTDDQPGESFNAAVKRQLDTLSAIYKDAEEHPTMKIGAVMHSRGMELLQSWVDEGCPDDYELDKKDLLKPDDPDHATVLRWHGDKVKEIDLDDDEEFKPGFYLILHSLTDDDTDSGNKELQKFLPPIEVHRACKAARDAGVAFVGITEPLADGEALSLEEIQKIADHFACVESATEPETTRNAWGGEYAERWTDRVFRKIARDNVEKAGEVEGEWVTIHGQHVLINDKGEVLAGSRSVTGGMEFVPSAKMVRALRSAAPAGRSEQKAADEQEAKLSRALGLPRTKDNSAFDLRNDRVGIELKTVLRSPSGKITMSKAALSRKESEAHRDKLKVYTVVADKRSGGTTYYYKAGVGSFRISNMTQATVSEIRSAIRGK